MGFVSTVVHVPEELKNACSIPLYGLYFLIFTSRNCDFIVRVACISLQKSESMMAKLSWWTTYGLSNLGYILFAVQYLNWVNGNNSCG